MAMSWLLILALLQPAASAPKSAARPVKVAPRSAQKAKATPPRPRNQAPINRHSQSKPLARPAAAPPSQPSARPFSAPPAPQSWNPTPATQARTQSPAPRLQRHSLALWVGIQSWQDQLTLTADTGNYRLVANILGGAIGAAWRIHLSPYFSLGVEGSGFFGASEAGWPSDAAQTQPLVYQARNASVAAGWVTPIFSWSPLPDRTELTLGVPLGVRWGNWPVPQLAGYSIRSALEFAPSVYLEGKLRWGAFGLGLRGGLLRVLPGVTWTLLSEYRL